MTCQGYFGDFLALNVYTNENSSGNPLGVIFLEKENFGISLIELLKRENLKDYIEKLLFVN